MATADIIAARMAAPGITSVVLPATIQDIDTALFAALPNAAAIQVAHDNPAYTTYNGMLFNKELTDLLLVPEGMEGAAVLPGSTVSVPACVFSRCTKLSTVSIPAGSTGSQSFTSWNGILYTNDMTTLVAAPAGLGASATIAPGCQTIAEAAFWGNRALKTIVANGAVADIQPAFAESVIKAATVVTADPQVWEAAGFKHFADPVQPGEAAQADGFAYTLLDDYTASVAWAGEGEAPAELTIPATAVIGSAEYAVSTIEAGAFAGQPIAALAVPEGISSIGERAFAGCAALTSAQLAGSVTSIGGSAFEGCTQLASVELGGGLRTIGASAFESTGLAEVVLPATLTTIADRAFASCPNLTAIVALASVPEVSDTALADTTGVSIYTPHVESSEYAWSIGPVASANHLLPYGAQTSASSLTLSIGEAANAFAEGGYLEAPGDAEVTIAYKANAVSADLDGTITAKQPGTTAVTYTVTYRDLPLAKATTTVIVPNPPAAPEAEPVEGEGDEETAASFNVSKLEQSINAVTPSDASASDTEDSISVDSDQFVELESDYEVEGGLNIINRTLKLATTSAPMNSRSAFSGLDVGVYNSGSIYIKSKLNNTWDASYTEYDATGGRWPYISVTRYALHEGDTASGYTWCPSAAHHLHLYGYYGATSVDTSRPMEMVITVGGRVIDPAWIVFDRWGTCETELLTSLSYSVNSVSRSVESIPGYSSMSQIVFYLNGAGDRTYTFNGNGGSVGTTSYTDVHPFETRTLYPQPTRSNFKFLGWYTAPTGGTQKSSTATFTTPQSESDSGTYYAHWGSSVTFKKNDGTSANVGTPIDMTYGEAIPDLSSAYKPERAGYRFLGWNTKADGSGTTYYDKELGHTYARKWEETGQSVNLYAEWGKVSTITFDLNGGYCSNIQPQAMTLQAADGDTLPTITWAIPTRSGLSFLGWYTGAGEYIPPSAERYYDENQKGLMRWNRTTNTTLYAKWGYSLKIVFPSGFQYGIRSATALVDQGCKPVNPGQGFVWSGAVVGDWEPAGLLGAPLAADGQNNSTVQLYYDKNSSWNGYNRPYQNQTLYAVYKKSGVTLNANNGALGSLEQTSYLITAASDNENDHSIRVCCGNLRYSYGGGTTLIGDAAWGEDWQPTRSTYKLLGFYDSRSGGTNFVTPDCRINHISRTVNSISDLSSTLYAQWGYARYTIAYNKNDTNATGTMSSNYGYWGTNPTISKCTFGAPTGKHFTGWNTKANGTGTKVDGSTTEATTYDGDLSTTNGGYVTLYAQWANNTYTISYNANGGTGSMETSSATCNTTNTISRCTFTAPTGYTFNGWNTKANGSGDPVSGSTTSTTTHTGNLITTHEGSVTLYAQWKANVYTISLSNKDADENGTSVVYLRYDDGYYSNSACTDTAKITKIVAPKRLGYDFGGYPGLTNSDGNITATAKAFSENKTGTDALNPAWNAYTCTILFDANYTGSTYATESWTFTFDDLKNSPRLPANPFERANHEFKEWNTNAAGSGTPYTDEFQVNDTLAKAVAESDSHTMKLFVQWTQVAFNVTYESNGGSAVSSEYVGVNNLIPDKMNPPATTRAGYTLEGWYESDTFEGEPWDFASDKMPRRDVKLYAKWSHNTFTVTFKAGRGTGEEQSRTYTYEALDASGGPLAQNLPNFDRELNFSCTGGKFIGWSEVENPGSTDKIWTNMADVRTGLSYGDPVTLYAQWDPVDYQVIYMANIPADSSSEEGHPTFANELIAYRFPDAQGDAPTLMANPFACTGYSFDGWRTSDNTYFADRAPVTELQELAIQGGNMIVLFAQWRGAEYQVRFEPNVPEGETAEGAMEDQTFYWGLADNLTPNAFKRPGGWVFDHWNTLPDDSGISYADGALVQNLRPEAGQDIPTLYAQWRITFDVDVPVVDHINVTMNPEGEWITVDSANIEMKSYSPLPVGVEGVGLEGNTENLAELLDDVSQANQLVVNLSSQGTTVPLSIGTTSTDANCYFRFEKGSAGDPAVLPLTVDLGTRNPGINLKEHVEAVNAFKLTFKLSVLRD